MALVSAEESWGPGGLQVAHCPAGPPFKLNGYPGARQSPFGQTGIVWSQEKTLDTESIDFGVRGPGSSPCSAIMSYNLFTSLCFSFLISKIKI